MECENCGSKDLENIATFDCEYEITHKICGNCVDKIVRGKKILENIDCVCERQEESE